LLRAGDGFCIHRCLAGVGSGGSEGRQGTFRPDVELASVGGRRTGATRESGDDCPRRGAFRHPWRAPSFYGVRYLFLSAGFSLASSTASACSVCRLNCCELAYYVRLM